MRSPDTFESDGKKGGHDFYERGRSYLRREVATTWKPTSVPAVLSIWSLEVGLHWYM